MKPSILEPKFGYDFAAIFSLGLKFLNLRLAKLEAFLEERRVRLRQKRLTVGS